MSSLSVGGEIDKRRRILVNFVPPLELGVRRGKYWRMAEIVLGISWTLRRRGALEFWYQGTTHAVLSESQILARILARVSVRAWKALSGEVAGMVILNSNLVSDGSVLLDRGGVAEREGSLLVAFAGIGVSATCLVALEAFSVGWEMVWSREVEVLVSTFGGKVGVGSRVTRGTGSAFSFFDCDLARCSLSGGEREAGAIITSVACVSGDVFVIIVKLDPVPWVTLERSAD